MGMEQDRHQRTPVHQAGSPTANKASVQRVRTDGHGGQDERNQGQGHPLFCRCTEGDVSSSACLRTWIYLGPCNLRHPFPQDVLLRRAQQANLLVDLGCSCNQSFGLGNARGPRARFRERDQQASPLGLSSLSGGLDADGEEIVDNQTLEGWAPPPG